MKSFVMLLRGINVGGKNAISMKELKVAMTETGYENVISYINSGNLLFKRQEADPLFHQAQLKKLIQEKFALDIPVLVMAGEEYLANLAQAPAWWNQAAETKHNAIFVLADVAVADVVAEVGEYKPEYENVASHGQVIFWSAPLKTFSKSRWSKVVGTKYYQSTTIRNANTSLKLVELLQQHQAEGAN